MAGRIKTLQVQDFRGATQPLNLRFDDSKRVLMIFGENGTGKSSIVDALECVGNGTTAFVNDWKLGSGKSKAICIPTLGKSLKDVRIALEFGGQTYNATLNKRGPLLCNTPERPVIKVLRRKSLQAFIDADPAQRYKEVASFLAIPEIEAAEASLREAYRKAKDAFDSASTANGLALEQLQGLWEVEGSPSLGQKSKNAEAWARQQAKADIAMLNDTLAALKSAVKLIEDLAAEKQKYTEAANDSKLAETAVQQAEKSLAVLEAEAVKSAAKLVTLLQEAKEYLSASADTLCPVCEQTKIQPDNLIQRLDQRITGMNSLKVANEAKSRANDNLKTKSALMQQAEQRLLETAEAARLSFNEEIDKAAFADDQSGDNAEAVQSAFALYDYLAARQADLQTQLDNTQKQCNTLAGIKQHVETLDVKAGEAKHAESLQKRLGLAVDIVEAKRKTYVETVLAEIAEAVDTLYQKIHPLENLGHLKLKLDEHQRGSLVYGVAFGEQQNIHPQPYYSESHLDTLGLCIFLALAKHGGASKTMVVLDDVLGSVDQQHLNRTLAMLFGEANSFAQIILTTHYRPLRDQLRYARSPSNSVQLMELKPWSFEQGIRSGKTISYVEELKQQLQEDTFRRDVIASQAGQLFENLLEFISRTYRCKVPHTAEPRFTFGELASAPNKELKKVLKIASRKSDTEVVESELAKIYGSLGEAINVRNLVGCHFNQWAGELADQDIRDMAELALEFADKLICEACGSLPMNSKSGSYWECSCKQTQMHPLQQPKK